MSLLRVNNISHISSTANNIILDSTAGVEIGNGLSSTGVIKDLVITSNLLLGIAGQNATGNQSIFGVGLAVEANTIYHYQGRYNFFKTAGATSHTFAYSWGGTATFYNNRIVTNMIVQNSAQGFATQNAARSVLHYVMETRDSVVVTPAIASAFYTVNLQVDGIFIPNASGTLIPQYALSAAPGGNYVHSGGNYLSVWPVGKYTGQANLVVGTWS